MVNADLIALLPGIYEVGCATGATHGYASTTWLLNELKSTVAASDVETWRAIFQFLGSIHRSLDRFNIVLGVLDALADEAEVNQWAPTWLVCLAAADIHPLSIWATSSNFPH